MQFVHYLLHQLVKCVCYIVTVTVKRFLSSLLHKNTEHTILDVFNIGLANESYQLTMVYTL